MQINFFYSALILSAVSLSFGCTKKTKSENNLVAPNAQKSQAVVDSCLQLTAPLKNASGYNLVASNLGASSTGSADPSASVGASADPVADTSGATSATDSGGAAGSTVSTEVTGSSVSDGSSEVVLLNNRAGMSDSSKLASAPGSAPGSASVAASASVHAIPSVAGTKCSKLGLTDDGVITPRSAFDEMLGMKNIILASGGYAYCLMNADVCKRNPAVEFTNVKSPYVCLKPIDSSDIAPISQLKVSDVSTGMILNSCEGCTDFTSFTRGTNNLFVKIFPNNVILSYQNQETLEIIEKAFCLDGLHPKEDLSTNPLCFISLSNVTYLKNLDRIMFVYSKKGVFSYEFGATLDDSGTVKYLDLLSDHKTCADADSNLLKNVPSSFPELADLKNARFSEFDANTSFGINSFIPGSWLGDRPEWYETYKGYKIYKKADSVEVCRLLDEVFSNGIQQRESYSLINWEKGDTKLSCFETVDGKKYPLFEYSHDGDSELIRNVFLSGECAWAFGTDIAEVIGSKVLSESNTTALATELSAAHQVSTYRIIGKELISADAPMTSESDIGFNFGFRINTLNSKNTKSFGYNNEFILAYSTGGCLGGDVPGVILRNRTVPQVEQACVSGVNEPRVGTKGLVKKTYGYKSGGKAFAFYSGVTNDTEELRSYVVDLAKKDCFPTPLVDLNGYDILHTVQQCRCNSTNQELFLRVYVKPSFIVTKIENVADQYLKKNIYMIDSTAAENFYFDVFYDGSAVTATKIPVAADLPHSLVLLPNDQCSC